MYLPPKPKDGGATTSESSAPELEEAKSKYDLVKTYRTALKNPKFMAKKIKERDCPIHTRWCSVVDAKNVDGFLEAYVQRAKKADPSLDPFTMFEEVSVVFPTVDTMDMFQLLNARKSYKDDRLQWTGHSETYSKIWSEMDLKRFVMSIALQIFLRQFDDMPSLVKLFEDINDLYKNIDDLVDPAAEDQFLKALEIRKHAVYTAWFNRVQESVSSLGDFTSIQRAMYTMLEYKQALGVVPYEPVKSTKCNTDRWVYPIRKIPDPYNIVMIKNARDNSYTCWNYKTNTEVYVLFDKFGVPFDTKLSQLLKAEYTYAELYIKQNGAHLSDGYILAERKEVDAPEEGNEEYKAALIAQRDKDDEEQWKRQLETLDDKVRYEETGGGHPTRIVMRGMARPQKIGYINRGFKGGSGSGGKKSDPASELVKMLQKQINTGEKASQDITRMIKSIITDEKTHLKGASKKLEDLVSSKHDFISKIHKNLDSVTKEIDDLTTDTADDNPATSFGVVPIRKMINGMATSMASVHDMIEKLEASMVAVGINPTAATETDMFREMDTRIGALTSAANHTACMEMRKVMENVEKMLQRMEVMMTTHTSSLDMPTAAHERTCVDNIDFDEEDFDDEFSRVIKGGEVTAADRPSGADSACAGAGEIYAEYYSKMRKTNDMYKTLKGNYEALVKDFQRFQVKTLGDVSKIAEYKSKTTDARNLVMIYKKFLAAQSKLNKEGMDKIEKVLQDLEGKVNKFNHERQMDRQSNVDNLKRLKDDLNAILVAVDMDETSDILGDAVTESDAVLAQLREQRVKDLDRVSETFRQNLEDLRKTFPLVEERRNARQKGLESEMGGGKNDDFGPSTSSYEGGSSTSYATTANEVNKSISEKYTGAMNRYHEMADTIDEERERLIRDAKVKDVEKRKRAEKARVERNAAVQEHNHLRAMKRYGDIIRIEGEAKRKKLCRGTHVADAMTVGKLKPMPQILVVDDHFRKAKIMPGVPERHMKDMRANIRDRWIDFVSNLFPAVTNVDNHGVKTWGINDGVVMSGLVLPFMKVRYGLKSPKFSPGLTSSSVASVKTTFNALCDEFVTDLLLHARDDEYKHLMIAFKPQGITEQTTKPFLHDFYGGR